MSSSEPGIVLGEARNRVALLFGLVSAAALLKELPFEPEVQCTHTLHLSGSDSERLVQAGAIARAYGMELRHRNGYYYASGGHMDFMELHFVPLIPWPPGMPGQAADAA